MISSETQPETVGLFETLRREIVSGELRPNAPLIELDLADRFQVSRTPVRESLQRLASVGLIVPRKRGWAVREFSADELRQNAEVRIALEGYAAGLAAARATAEQIARLEAIHAERLRLRSTDEDTRVRTNRDFHDTILAAAGNDRLVDAIFQAGQFYFNAPIARVATGNELALGNKDHELILEAIRARDAAAAERTMRSHIERTFAVFWRLTGGRD